MGSAKHPAKLAASAPQDDKAVAEAFAQQAYTVIGNRDRDIMRDPYMLGFEIVYKNEENTRLVGVFAFRLPSEILLAPVFYNNGQVKGQDLLYRKGSNRFVPNTEKWISYLLSRGEPDEGQAISRQTSRARMNLDLAQIGGSRLKEAAVSDIPFKDTGEVDIKRLWKEAMAAWKAEEPQHLFADVLLATGMQKQAAELARRCPEWAEMLEFSGALDKQAAPMPDTAVPAPMPQSMPVPELPEAQPFSVTNQADPLAEAQDNRMQLAGGQAGASNYALMNGEFKSAGAGVISRATLLDVLIEFPHLRDGLEFLRVVVPDVYQELEILRLTGL